MILLSKPLLTEKEINAVAKVLRSGNLAQGKLVEKFEQDFADYIGTKYAVATNSGTAALHTAMAALDLRRGDEVVTTPFSFVASANAILYCGGKPIFVDINPDDYNLNPKLIEKKITKNTKAVLVVHLYGQPANMGAISKICKKHKLALIEDACQAHGAEYKNHKVGGIGHLGCFSFYPTKNITTGEGGIVTTNSKSFYNSMRIFRNHGQSARYFQDTLGFNYRMSDIYAAIGIEQLKSLSKFNRARIKNAQYLTSKLSDIPGLILPAVFKERIPVYHQFTIRITKEAKLNRDALAKILNKNEVGYGIYYPITIPEQKHYKDLGYSNNYPIAQTASEEVISIPVGPHVNKSDLDFIAGIIKEHLL